MFVVGSERQAADYRTRHGLDPSEAAGLRSLHGRAPALTAVYDALEAGLEDDPEARWASVCERHSTLVVHRTRRLAEHHAVDPAGWCEPCRSELEERR